MTLKDEQKLDYKKSITEHSFFWHLSEADILTKVTGLHQQNNVKVTEHKLLVY